MHRDDRQAELLLNGQSVGLVTQERCSGEWAFGRFTPGESFSQFAALFGAWSLLIHEDEDQDRTDPALLEELAYTEAALDRLDAVLQFGASEKRPICQVNIDGDLIEWKSR